MSIKTKLVDSASKALVERGGKAAGKKGAEAAAKKGEQVVAKTFAKDASKLELASIKLSPEIQELTDMGKMMAEAGQDAQAKSAFVNAATASLGTQRATDKGITEALGVARIAHHSAPASDAAKTIVNNTIDRATSYGQRTEIAEAARKMGLSQQHLTVVKQMATFPPDTETAVALADALRPMAQADKAYAPVVTTALESGLKVSTRLDDIKAVQAAALSSQNIELANNAMKIRMDLISQGHTGNGDFSPQIKMALRELGY